MNNYILYTTLICILFFLVAFYIYQIVRLKNIKTVETKKYEIIQEYKNSLKQELDKIDDNSLRIEKKKLLLKIYSDELSMNIFFDSDEIRDIVLELLKEK